MKVVFVINSIGQQRCFKRIREFQENGYETCAYAFSRYAEDAKKKEIKDVTILANYTNDTPYRHRVSIIYKALKKVVKAHEKEQVIYYFFGLDLIMLALPLVWRKPYIYEESDLFHTYLGIPKVATAAMEIMDKWIIRHSLLTVMTSEGFAEYHYGKGQLAEQVVFIPNRIDQTIKKYKVLPLDHELDTNHLRIGFLGAIRSKSLADFTQYVIEKYPQHEMHFYGFFDVVDEHYFEFAKNNPKCHLHGRYSNPVDLPGIYSQLDMVISMYSTDEVNNLFAEPNKLYEAVYFQKPIIVTENTYLGRKVTGLGIGYEVNDMDLTSIDSLFAKLTVQDLRQKAENERQLGEEFCVNNNTKFFLKLAERIKKQKLG